MITECSVNLSSQQPCLDGILIVNGIDQRRGGGGIRAEQGYIDRNRRRAATQLGHLAGTLAEYFKIIAATAAVRCRETQPDDPGSSRADFRLTRNRKDS